MTAKLDWLKSAEIEGGLKVLLIQQARTFAEQQGWPWPEPIEVTSETYHGGSIWVVKTNTMAMGRNVRVVIRKSDQEIVQSGFLPR